MRFLGGTKLALLSSVGLWFACMVTVQAENYSQQMDSITQALAGKMQTGGVKRITVAEFTDLTGNKSEFGRFLQDELSVDLTMIAGESKSFAVQSGFVLPMKAGQPDMGKLPQALQSANLDAVIMGTFTASEDQVTVAVKVISATSTADIAAVTAKFDKTKDIAGMIGHVDADSSPVSSTFTTPPALVTKASQQNDQPIAMSKDPLAVAVAALNTFSNYCMTTLAADNGPHNRHPRLPCHIGQNLGQLDVHLLECFLHMQYMRRSMLDELRTMA